MKKANHRISYQQKVKLSILTLHKAILINGLGHAINKSIEEFKEEVGQTSLTRQKYSDILKDKNHKFYPLAKDIIDIPIEEQAEEIFQTAKTEIDRANNEIDIIVVYGGGSILMRDALEPKLRNICKSAKINLFYVDEKRCSKS